MGNPAAERRKKSEKRRAKFEKRFQGLAYVPKEIREEFLKQEAAAAKK